MDKDKFDHLVLDLETLGIGTDAAVLTVGALKFNPTKGDIHNYLNNKTQINENNCFYKKVNLETCLDIGCTVDNDTLKWWSQQGEKAIADAFSEDGREPLKDVLKDLNKFSRSCKYFWAKSPSFDMVILESAAKKLGLGVSWEYYQTRCIRTIEDVIDFKSAATNTHNALEDCIYEAYAVEQFYKKVGTIK